MHYYTEIFVILVFSTLKMIVLLVEIRFWNLEVSAVSDSLDGEDEGFSGEHGQLAHHLPRVGHKQAHSLLLVDHPLVDVQTARQDKVQTHVLEQQKGEEGEKANTERRVRTTLFYILTIQ